MTAAERRHVERVKSLPCVVCRAPPPSEAHEPVQGLWFASMALCADCHRHPQRGLHGAKDMWRIYKMSEWDAINETIKELSK